MPNLLILIKYQKTKMKKFITSVVPSGKFLRFFLIQYISNYTTAAAWIFVLSGKLHVTSQQICFPVNGPFVCSCLGLICLNIMCFTCFGTFNKLLQRKKIVHCSDCTRICYCSGKKFVHWLHSISLLHGTNFFLMQ